MVQSTQVIYVRPWQKELRKMVNVLICYYVNTTRLQISIRVFGFVLHTRTVTTTDMYYNRSEDSREGDC